MAILPQQQRTAGRTPGQYFDAARARWSQLAAWVDVVPAFAIDATIFEPTPLRINETPGVEKRPDAR
jgi:hypothetical protein